MLGTTREIPSIQHRSVAVASNPSAFGMLIDEYLPRYDVVERHAITVRATPSRTYAAIKTTNFADGTIIRLLFFIRGLPEAILRGGNGFHRGTKGRTASLTIKYIEAAGFRLLAERPSEEMVIGIEGRFWTASGDRCTPTAEAFRSSEPAAGTARAVWNFHLRALDAGTCELTTETRVLCADAATRRRFLPYWTLIRPGSGLIRHSMLRAIRRSAELQDTAGAAPAAT